MGEQQVRGLEPRRRAPLAGSEGRRRRDRGPEEAGVGAFSQRWERGACVGTEPPTAQRKPRCARARGESPARPVSIPSRHPRDLALNSAFQYVQLNSRG